MTASSIPHLALIMLSFLVPFSTYICCSAGALYKREKIGNVEPVIMSGNIYISLVFKSFLNTEPQSSVYEYTFHVVFNMMFGRIYFLSTSFTSTSPTGIRIEVVICGRLSGTFQAPYQGFKSNLQTITTKIIKISFAEKYLPGHTDAPLPYARYAEAGTFDFCSGTALDRMMWARNPKQPRYYVVRPTEISKIESFLRR
jgi:hypothetical protein